MMYNGVGELISISTLQNADGVTLVEGEFNPKVVVPPARKY